MDTRPYVTLRHLIDDHGATIPPGTIIWLSPQTTQFYGRPFEFQLVRVSKVWHTTGPARHHRYPGETIPPDMARLATEDEAVSYWMRSTVLCSMGESAGEGDAVPTTIWLMYLIVRDKRWGVSHSYPTEWSPYGELSRGMERQLARAATRWFAEGCPAATPGTDPSTTAPPESPAPPLDRQPPRT